MIVEKLNDYYTKLPRRDFKIGPSNLGSCLREAAYLLMGEKPEPLRPEQARAFELGSQRGEALEAVAKAIWSDAQSQVPVEIPCGRHILRGTCDLWIPSLRTVVDFKTQATFGYALLDSEGVSPEYALQVHAYREGIARMIGLEPLPLTGLTGAMSGIKALLIYEAKDSDGRKGIKAQELKELEVPWTEELEKRYRARLKEIELLLDLKEQGNLIPGLVAGLPKTNGKAPWKCREVAGVPQYCAIGPTRGKCHS